MSIECMKAEGNAFVDRRGAAEASALAHISFAERQASAPDWITAQPADIGQVTVAGGGATGAGIAFALVAAGLKVVLVDADPAALARAKENVDRLISNGAALGWPDNPALDATRARFRASTDFADAGTSDLAIEAVSEDMRAEALAALEKVLPPGAVIATSASYSDPGALAAGLADPSRLVGLHFFAPAHAVKLLEIARGKMASDRALATGFALAGKLRKFPVLSGVCDGLIADRIAAHCGEAADTLLMDGTNPWELDEAMVAFGFAMGPYEAQDISGLDTAYAIRRRQDGTRNPSRRYVPIADRMVAEGRLGRKTCVGWYRYPGGGGKVIDPLVEDLVREEAYFAKVARRQFDDDEIRRRLILAMINEASDILWEGIAARASDIDLATVHGLGFPRRKGGLMYHADRIGARRIGAALRLLAAEDAIAWKPSPLIDELAASGGSFAEWRRG